MPEWNRIATAVEKAIGIALGPASVRLVMGGDTNAAAILQRADQRVFVKYRDGADLSMYIAEADGLAALAEANVVRTPRPLCYGVAGTQAFLALEHLELEPAGDMAQEQLGRRLAALHRITQPWFGWHRDNTIGATPQQNTQKRDWVEFWRTCRLGFQLERARNHAHAKRFASKADRLLTNLPAFFKGHAPAASLLHGDLWAGNAAQTPSGEPVIFDPAVYFGDREAELAMTELFGGFGQRFYAAYREAWPLDTGYAVRRNLYNLYHVLNHANLFGGGYWQRSERMIESLLADIG